MPPIVPFIRQVEVLLGPVEEWRGGGDASQQVRLFGDGGLDSLRIKFSVIKHLQSTASPTIIQVYNLSPGLRDSLQAPGIKVELSAGWRSHGLYPLFSGTVLAISHQRAEADVVTSMYCLAGWGATSRAEIALTFSDETNVSDLVLALASTLPGVTVDEALIQVGEWRTGPQGWSYWGSTAGGLDRLSREFGFSWWIDKGVFHAGKDGKPIASSGVILSEDQGVLFRVEPMLALSGPEAPRQTSGISLQSLLNPWIDVGKSYRLESKLNTSLNKTYYAHSVRHEGDTHSPQWTTSIDSWEVM